jgi:hypothetical protein
MAPIKKNGHSFVFDVNLHLKPDAAPRSVHHSLCRYIEGLLSLSTV